MRTLATAVGATLCLWVMFPASASAQAEPDADALSLEAPAPLPPPDAPAPARPEGQAPEFPTATEVVTVDVVVLDEAGSAVEGLTADDFTISDEGRRRPVSRFEAIVVPASAPPPAPDRRELVSSNAESGARAERAFAVVFDDVHMDPIGARAAKSAVRGFVETMLRPGDRVVLIPSSGGAWWHARIPEGQRDLVAALDRLEGLRPRDFSIERITDWEAMRLYLHRDRQVGAQVTRRYYEYRIILDPPCTGGDCAVRKSTGETHPIVRVRAGEVYGRALARKRASYAALQKAAESLQLLKGRKAILFMSEGFLQEPERPEHWAMVRAAQRANAAIHFIDTRGLLGIPATADAELGDHTDLRDMGPQLNEAIKESLGAAALAAETGGRVLKNMNDPATGLRRLERESRAYYLIGFEPTGIAADGAYHRLDIQVRRPGYEVLARRGYYAPTAGPMPDESAREASLVRRALDSPFDADGIPLRMTSYVLGPADEGTTVLLVADVDPRALVLNEEDGRLRGALGVHIAVSHRETGERLVRDREVSFALAPKALEEIRKNRLPLMIDVPLAAGHHQARLLVRDERSGAMGTVSHELEVPPLEAFRLSTPILTDVVLPAGDGDASMGRPVPLARRTFAHDKTLALLYQVYGARSVVAGYHVEARDGTVVASQPDAPLPRGPGGEVSQMAVISLAGVSAGDYAVVVQARDTGSGQIRTSQTPFRVEPPPGAVARDVPAEAPPATDPELADLLERAGRYVIDYEKRFQDIVVEETYSQRVDAHGSGLEAKPPQHRVTRADMVFVRLAGDVPWACYRDVFQVDGREVRERDARLEKLFLEAHPSATERARAILEESGAYNLGPAARTVNIPTLPLIFLHPHNQGRFAFERKGKRRIAGVEGVELRFVEVRRPTIVRRDGTSDLPAQGRVWIDPVRGTVLRTEVRFDFALALGIPSQASLTAEYRPAAELAMWVPVEMHERYEDLAGRQRFFGPTVVATARYSNYRRFNVSVQTEAHLPEE